MLEIYRVLVRAQNGRDRSVERFLAEERIDAVVHPTVLEGLFVSDLVRWREVTKRPLVFLMNSWDNPSSKAMTLGVDALLAVWGEQTRRHAVAHLGWSPERIRCLGAAQFEIYKHPPVQKRAEFLGSLDLDPDQRTLLYAGSSRGLNEVQHLRELDGAIEDGRLSRCQIVFRPHPWRGVIAGEEDFFTIAWRNVRMDPQLADYYRLSRLNSKLIFTPDYQHTHALLSAVDAVISPISTILLEAAMHGKPIMAYIPDEEARGNTFLWTSATLRYMREFYERIECGPVRSQADFVPACQALLARAALPDTSKQLRAASEFFVTPTDRPYGELVASLVDEISRQ